MSESERLMGIARRLVEGCPVELGPEIAVTGSVSKGYADDGSDIEINFWLEREPEEARVREWLGTIGVGRALRDPDLEMDTLWLGFEYEGVWFEAGWQAYERVDETLDAILALRKLGEGDMMFAEVIHNAVPLRSQGRIEGWKERVARYPDGLAEAIIERELGFWEDPQWVMQRWTEARRHHWISLMRELRHDIARCLRIVWALNRRWEPDWKWVPETLSELQIQPPDFVARINSVYSLSTGEERIVAAYELAMDTLALLPEGNPRARQARRVLTHSLATRGSERMSLDSSHG